MDVEDMLASSQDLPPRGSSARDNSDSEPDFHDSELLNRGSLSQGSAKKRKHLSPLNGTSNKKRKSVSSPDKKRKKKRKSRDAALDSIADEEDQRDIPDSSPVLRSDRRDSLAEAEADSRTNAGARDIESDSEFVAREASQEYAANQSTHNEMDEARTESRAESPTEAPAELPTEAPTEAQTQTSTDGATSRPRRAPSTRKKSKPTYFEAPLPALPPEAFENLNAPPRRAKKAKKGFRRKQKADRLQDHSDEADHSHEPDRRTYTTGQFTTFELQRIADAIEGFRVEHDLEQREVNEMIQARGGTTAGELHAKLWSRIFDECPDRHRQKVINTARKKFHNYVARGTWTDEQHKELSELVDKIGHKWSEIGALINRHAEDVRDRFRNYVVCGEKQKKAGWDSDEEAGLTKFVNMALEEVARMRREDPDKLDPNRTDEDHVDWQGISENMKRTRSRLQCMTKWKSMKSRGESKVKPASSESESTISLRLDKARRQLEEMPDTEKYRLVLAIKSTQASITAKIPWQKLCDKQFRSSWQRATQELVWSRLLKSVPGSAIKQVQECAQYLVDEYDQNGELPNIGGEGWDDDEEMVLLAQVPAGRRESRKSTSSEKLTLEDMQDDDVDPAKPNDDDVDGVDMEANAQIEAETENLIDPALDTLAEVPQSAQKATPAKRSQKGKRPSARKPRKSMTALEESADIAVGAEETDLN
ncbi:Myb transcription factor [Cordyceps fumosorosea ARSEF 2679]|uniref:Myb transcription factor n=1 Tax=Cordyceps fumosorosea (strain ARSEF 2679) TaxID=1081104 RepID=A0A168B310_CORFA|nr:Myb transcription factor [Cordyceps fumosorosea ARSEF 2679]OAA69550.1 Myb transcription factor [Cordyceps fumosorosea ARSEF 2679]